MCLPLKVHPPGREVEKDGVEGPEGTTGPMLRSPRGARGEGTPCRSFRIPFLLLFLPLPLLVPSPSPKRRRTASRSRPCLRGVPSAGPRASETEKLKVFSVGPVPPPLCASEAPRPSPCDREVLGVVKG